MKNLTGQFLNPDGTPVANGVLTLTLSQDAVSSTGQVSPTPLTFTLDANGNLTASVLGNDELTPTGTYYTAALDLPGGAKVYGPESWVIIGTSPINVQTLTPTTTGMSYPTPIISSPTGSQTVTQPASTSLTLSGTVNVKTLENVRYADQFTGADIGAQVNAAIADLPTQNGYKAGLIVIPAGVFVQTTTITVTSPQVYITGAGKDATTLNYTGTGDAIRWNTSPFTTSYRGGGLANLRLDGAGGTGNGLHVGDIISFTAEDVTAINFTGIGKAGFWFDNATNFTEEGAWKHLIAYNCTIGFRFTVESTSNSFGYNNFDLYFNGIGASQIGVQLENGSQIYNSFFRLTGNLNASTHILLNLINTASIKSSWIWIQAEMTGSVPPRPIGIQTATGTNLQGSGYVSFLQCTISAAAGTYNIISLDGAQEQFSGIFGNGNYTGALLHIPNGTVGLNSGLVFDLVDTTSQAGIFTDPNNVGYPFWIGRNWASKSAPATNGYIGCDGGVSGTNTVQMPGTNAPPALAAASFNPVLRLGGNAVTDSAGYQSLALNAKWIAGGQINESIGFDTSFSNGFGNVEGSNIGHPIAWYFVNDPTAFEIYAKSSLSALTAGLAVFSVKSGGAVSRYNNIATVSNGVPSEYATVDLTAQAAAVATATLYAVPATGAGQYRVSWNSKVTTAATTSSTLGALTITYTDPDGVVQTITAGALTSAGALATTNAGNTTASSLLGVPLLLNCKASTNIQYAYAYVSSGATAMQYNLHVKVEAL